jgi:U3 small nucleolar ribonucleoprotein component
MRAKSLATRAARKAAREAKAARREAAESKPVAEEPMTLADLGLAPADDPFDDVLTAAEISEIRKAARTKVDAERKNKHKKALMDAALEEYRREAGEIPLDEEQRKYNEEMVTIRVSMPTLRKAAGHGEHAPEPIILDQKIFHSGGTYTVPRAQAVYIANLMDLARRHVNQVDGRSRTYYAEPVGQMIYQGGTAAGGGSIGQSFDAIHRRPA